MKKHSICSKLISMLLVLSMVLAWVPMSVFAAEGDLAEGETGLQDGTEIDTTDIIGLPIEIYDYEADGMLFEFAQTQSVTSADQWLRPENAPKPSANLFLDFTLGDEDYSLYYYNHQDSTATAEYVEDNADSGNKETMTWLEWGDGFSYLTDFGTYDGFTGVYPTFDSIQYLTLVLRTTNGTGGDYFSLSLGLTQDNNTRSKTITPYYNNKGETWRYLVVDLADTGVTSGDTIYDVKIDYMIDGTGIAFAGFFPTPDAAKQFGEAALYYTGETYHYTGDNRGFGLLRNSRTTAYGNNSESDIISTLYANAGIRMVNTYADSTNNIPAAALDVSTLDLGYDKSLTGTIAANGIATLGLLQYELVDGLPVYKPETVAYVAALLQGALGIPEVDSAYGYKNYNFVQGAPHERYKNADGTERDFAQWLRDRMAANSNAMGSYENSHAKRENLTSTWEKAKDPQTGIVTWFDAAYFMLNSLFVANSYNTAKTDYNYLLLSGALNSDGKKIYVFDGGFATSAATDGTATSAVKYDQTNHTIQNSSGLGKTFFYYDDYSTTTYYPLLPIVDENGNNTGNVTDSPYFLDPGVAAVTTTSEHYIQRNYNYVIASHGQFTYIEDDNLYFNFEGDDDVYLFINGRLALDIGGAHGITSYKLDLNDCKDALGLTSGMVYRFDFFYMERHGTGANMRIETNMRLTDPDMEVNKTAYQNGQQVEYGGIVDGNQIVEYGFAITSSGEEDLFNLSFNDSAIGVALTPEKGLEVTGNRVTNLEGAKLEASDLTATITHPDYNDINITFADNDALRLFLHDMTAEGQGTEAQGGLFDGATVLFRGIGYTLSEEEKAAGFFDNTLFASATNSNSTKSVQDYDNMRVYVPTGITYYQWANHNLDISLDKLVTDIAASAQGENNALKNLTKDIVSGIAETNRLGYNKDFKEVTVSDDYQTITVNYSDPGSHVFFLKVSYSGTHAIIPVVVNVTDVEDSVFVLDYGLSVDLTAGSELFKNDTVTVPGYDTSYSLLGIGTGNGYANNQIDFTVDSDGVYEANMGTFTLSGSDLTYKPSKFMETIDTVQVAVNVYENGYNPSNITGDLNISKEVEMYKSISIIPATVIYYEDDFPAIKYVGDGTTNNFDRIGSSGNQNQSNDQDQEYGQDDAYKNNDAYSGGVLTTIPIDESGKVAYFTFSGAGFELISRTNAEDSAIITIKIYKSTEAPDGVPVEGATALRTIPVITEYDNGANGGDEAIYQVPVIRVDDLDWGSYTVLISGVPARDYENFHSEFVDGKWVYYYEYTDENGEVQKDYVPEPNVKDTKLYVDGLRIYQPLNDDHKGNDYYLDTEKGADFVEIRDEIIQGNIAAAKYDGQKLEASTGIITWTEKYEDEEYENNKDSVIYYYVGNQVTSVNDYLMQGPNNEVYMAGNSTDVALVFYVKEKTGEGAHNLQIAVHAVDEGLFYGAESTGMNAVIQYGVKTGDNFEWEYLVTVTSGTEQYYTIDYTNAPLTEQGYQIAVKVESGLVSFTSLKLNGLELVSIGGQKADFYYKDGILTELSTGTAAAAQNYMDFQTLSLQMKSDLIATDEAPDDAPVDEPTETPDDTPVEEGFAKPTRQDKIRKLLQMMEMLRRRR